VSREGKGPARLGQATSEKKNESASPFLMSKRTSPTFALGAHYRPSRRRIPFAFNGGTAETGQVKTLPLF
jgi:hypothetical protein